MFTVAVLVWRVCVCVSIYIHIYIPVSSTPLLILGPTVNSGNVTNWADLVDWAEVWDAIRMGSERLIKDCLPTGCLCPGSLDSCGPAFVLLAAGTPPPPAFAVCRDLHHDVILSCVL